MRIAIYKDTLSNRRGADKAVLALADALRGRGFDVCLFEKPDLEKRMAESWDAVISTGTNELLDLAELFPKRFPFRVIQQFHTNPGSQFKRKRLFRNWRIRRALRRVDAIQVLREAFVAQVEGYGVPIRVIGNWSDIDSTGIEISFEKRIVYPAAFGGKKNHKLLIDAFSLLQDEFPDWTLELYGGGTPPVNLPTNVRVMGYAENLADAYAKCAFVAFPSLDEGFGLVIADAAKFGKPAVMVADWIGTAHAGGGLVTKNNVADYASALRKLMSDPELCRTMGENARVHCQAHYSRERILDDCEKLLADLKE